MLGQSGTGASTGARRSLPVSPTLTTWCGPSSTPAPSALAVSVRGGSYNVAGTAVADGALVIDLTDMNGIRVDAPAKRAWVQPGVRTGDLLQALEQHRLAVPVGRVSQVGVAGLTLGGGIGALMGTYGLTIDNVISLEVVTADGRVLRAAADENPDLYWALRGGGGNFGVVTEFEFELHEQGTMLAGRVVHPATEAADLLRLPPIRCRRTR